jgi:hypothetical protein
MAGPCSVEAEAMRDAFGVSKSHRRVVLRQLRDSSISATYDRSRKKRVNKSLGNDIKFGLAHKKMALKYLGKKPAYKAMDKYYAAKNKVLPKKDMKNFGDISKIAMQPVYHGTSAKNAARLMAGKKWNVSGKKYADEPKRLIFTASQEKKEVANLFGVMRTARSKHAKVGTIHDRDPKPKKARVLTYNAVGVKPVHTNMMERVYDAESLGRPLASHKIPSGEDIERNYVRTKQATGIEAVDEKPMYRGSLEDAVRGVKSMPTKLPEHARVGLERQSRKALKRWKKQQRQRGR